MVGKMLSNISVSNTFNYNGKDESELIDVHNLTGENEIELQKQMIMQQNQFDGRAKNLTAHIILSPSIADGKELTLEEWKKIACTVLVKANLHQYSSVVYLHFDKAHKHMHLIGSRVKDSKIYRNGNELAMIQRIANEISKEFNIESAADIRNNNKRNIELNKRKKHTKEDAEIRDELIRIANQLRREKAKFSYQDYFHQLQLNNFTLKLFKKKYKTANTDDITGYAVRKNGKKFINASALSRMLTLNYLSNTDSAQNELEYLIYKIQAKEILKRCVRKTTEGNKKFSLDRYFKQLKNNNLEVVKHQSRKNSKLTGYAIKLNGYYLNSSEIDPDLTIGSFKQRFGGIKNYSTFTREEEQILVAQMQNSIFDELRVLRREIDKVKIREVLTDLTLSQKCKNVNAFFHDLHQKGFKAHLRYRKDTVVGYTIHCRIEHYHEDEIDRDKFSLSNLHRLGFLEKMPSEQRDCRKTRMANFKNSIYNQIYKAQQKEELDRSNQTIEYSVAENNKELFPSRMLPSLSLKSLKENTSLSLIDDYNKWLAKDGHKHSAKSVSIVKETMHSALETLEENCPFNLEQFLRKLKGKGLIVSEYEPADDPSKNSNTQRKTIEKSIEQSVDKNIQRDDNSYRR